VLAANKCSMIRKFSTCEKVGFMQRPQNLNSQRAQKQPARQPENKIASRRRSVTAESPGLPEDSAYFMACKLFERCVSEIALGCSVGNSTTTDKLKAREIRSYLINFTKNGCVFLVPMLVEQLANSALEDIYAIA
jgi:hypothetical protein